MSFLNFLISGISLGSIYAIIALGYTMVYGIAKMLNFAHGDVIMLSLIHIWSVPAEAGEEGAKGGVERNFEKKRKKAKKTLAFRF